MGRLHDSSGNSHRGAVAPFLDHRPHIVMTPCNYIAATILSGIQACVNNVDTVHELCKNPTFSVRSEEHTSELQSQSNLVCRLLLEKKNIHILVECDVRLT